MVFVVVVLHGRKAANNKRISSRGGNIASERITAKGITSITTTSPRRVFQPRYLSSFLIIMWVIKFGTREQVKINYTNEQKMCVCVRFIYLEIETFFWLIRRKKTSNSKVFWRLCVCEREREIRKERMKNRKRNREGGLGNSVIRGIHFRFYVIY